MLLEVKNLCVSLNGKILLNNVNLQIKRGYHHRLLGQNGSGKSTLVNTIAGNSMYKIESGIIKFNNQIINSDNATQRALKGIFLGAQNVPEIPGLTILNFLKHSMMAHYMYKNKKELIMGQFLTNVYAACEQLHIPKEWLNRHVNVGFSGGERKRIMLLRLLLTKPLLAILDEPDSGADIRVQKQIIDTINSLPNTTILLISHQDTFANNINIKQTTCLDNEKNMI